MRFDSFLVLHSVDFARFSFVFDLFSKQFVEKYVAFFLSLSLSTRCMLHDDALRRTTKDRFSLVVFLVTGYSPHLPRL